MANKRARDRQLAKLAARRQAERVAKRRRRNAAMGVGAAIAAVAVVAGYFAIRGGGGEASASSSSTPKASAAAERPVKTGSVEPKPAPRTVACGASAPNDATSPRPQYSSAPPLTIDPTATYSVKMRTSCGTIDLQLLPDKAPVAVNNFVFLARRGFYDGLRFHRVVPGFVIQGGDPLGDGTGGPGYQFDNEVAKGETFDRPGVLAMANSGPNTNGSQFFITVGKATNLTPDQYTIFGHVTKGLDVAERIASVPAANEQAKQAIYIESVAISERKGASGG
jgi:cyclophilin family peptidyl-prolyl cis-trans isomerase